MQADDLQDNETREGGGEKRKRLPENPAILENLVETSKMICPE